MFEQSLVAASSPLHPANRWRYLPFALVLHAGLFAALTAANTWDVEEIGEPPFPIVFFSARPMPSLGSPTEPERQRAETTRPPGPVTTTATTVQPRDIPTTVPTTPTGGEEPATGPTSDLPLTGGGGPGGPGISDTPGGGDIVVTLPPPPQEPIRYVIGMTPPQVVTRVEPRYPPAARMVRDQGTVVLEVVVDADGGVGKVTVLRGISKLLDEAAVAAVRQWRFRPARLAGEAVPAFHTVTVKFELRR